MAKAKYLLLADRLLQRVRLGDYHLNGLPSERNLAVEAGVSMMTARKAIQKLVDDGLFCRDRKGHLQLQTQGDLADDLRQVAILVPAFESSGARGWQNTIVHAAGGLGAVARTVHYSHWDDPTFWRTLEGFDGSFILPLAEEPHAKGLDRLRSLDKPVVALNQDWTRFGLPTLRLFPTVAVAALLDHLYETGRRRIACYAAQPEEGLTKERVLQWQMWMSRHSIEGLLFHEPDEAPTDTLEAAFEGARSFLIEHGQAVDAALCLSDTAAVGLLRACVDAGIRPGVDLAICSPGSRLGRFAVPSITSLTNPDASTLVSTCLEWMFRSPASQWIGPLMIEPVGLRIERRESTPDVSKAPTKKTSRSR